MAGRVERGVLESFAAATHTAEVRLDRDPGSLLVGVKVLGNVYGDWIAVDDRVLVWVSDDLEAVLLGPIKTAVSWPTSAFITTTDGTVYSLTTYVAHAAAQLSITVASASYLLLTVSMIGFCNTVRTTAVGVKLYITPTIGSTVEKVWGQSVASTRQPHTYILRQAVAAGTFTVDVQLRLKNVGDNFRFSRVDLMCMAVAQ